MPGEIYQVIIQVYSEIHGIRAQPLKATDIYGHFPCFSSCNSAI